MSKGVCKLPIIKNEPVLTYAPNSIERAELKKVLAELNKGCVDIPMIINGEEIRTNNLIEIRPPHNHKHLIGYYHQGNKEHVAMAIDAALKAKPAWEDMNCEIRAAIFLKAAELVSGP